jgi:hypothetical protein
VTFNLRYIVRVALEGLHVNLVHMDAEEAQAIRSYVVLYVNQHAETLGFQIQPERILHELDQELANRARRCT